MALSQSNIVPRSIPANAQSDAKIEFIPLGYLIGPGDVLQVNVLNEPAASAAVVVVRSDGVISLPLIKDVRASGLTPKQLERVVTEGLSQFIRDADVTVLVREIHSEKVYVIGAVRKEGPIFLQAPLTVLQAIAEAGGLTDYAKRNRIYVLRQVANQRSMIPFDYRAVIKGEHADQNVILQPGDTIVVPE